MHCTEQPKDDSFGTSTLKNTEFICKILFKNAQIDFLTNSNAHAWSQYILRCFDVWINVFQSGGRLSGDGGGASESWKEDKKQKQKYKIYLITVTKSNLSFNLYFKMQQNVQPCITWSPCVSLNCLKVKFASTTLLFLSIGICASLAAVGLTVFSLLSSECTHTH